VRPNPPCLKDKKAPLGTDGKLLDHNAPDEAYATLNMEGHDEWTLNYETTMISL
jgi:hypothetical protein